MNGPGGLARGRQFIFSALTAFFCGSPHLAFPQLGTYMSQVGLNVDRTWTPTDEHAYLFLLAFDHNTTFLLSESYR